MLEDSPTEADGIDAPSRGGSPLRMIGIGVVSCLLFIAGLLLTEAPGEVATDVDLKPFFLVYLLVAVCRFGFPTLSAGLGAAVGEGVLDVFEGYELDDPIGFIGYVVGFTVFGWYLHRVAGDPSDGRAQVVAAVLGAFAQAFAEGVAFLAIDADAGVTAAAVSVGGNTVTHGVVLGAIPLVLLYPTVAGYVGTEANDRSTAD
ncbi:hypothetical protein [Haloplanus salinus]|jgi:hypothetical protein|uniref:hypothetical protein n=1 Tax=Haloplanus salinus TaxID=1126245 RepID=UPI0015F09293|nr:hypothetical protein [Haloplanus salinus]